MPVGTACARAEGEPVPLGTEKRATASSCFARKAAFGIGKIELSERTQYGIGGNARLTVAARGFAVDLGGQGIADAVTQRAGGGGVGLVFCGTDAVIAADVACFKRPFVQAFCQKSAAAVKRHIDDDGAPQYVGGNDLGVAAAADGRRQDEFVFARFDVAAHLFDAVEVEVDRAGQGAFAEVGAQRGSLFPRAGVVSAGDFDTADACAAP
ncbi:hypothetical protein HMPREF3156_01836 [Neisseria sp. HMSC06F02]|nr:hypothetical protein HMPREF3156_01836 [Neisseria sp. HMSC06F02]